MTRDISSDISKIRLLLTEPHECSYLDGQKATTAFVDPEIKMDTALYGRMSAIGFRRSGAYLYTPMCHNCNACVPTRVPVDLFKRNRSQRRCWNRNLDVQINQRDAIDLDEHYPIYERYISDRHHDGDMFPPTREQFDQFLGHPWECTNFLEFRVYGKLIGCAVVDVLPDALSAIYTYFDPLESPRSLGTLAVLFQISLAQQLGMGYLYLGYWIKDCQKMSYKTNYRPLELLQENTWLISE
jgi:arginyl-tRNA--protein-N-Asp/Glu arginylyltransferase